MVTRIVNGRIVTDTIETGKSVYIKDDRILEVSDRQIESDYLIDAQNNYVSPGFIDIHCHGGGGCDFMDGAEAVNIAAETHLAHGTTTIMPTTVSGSIGSICRAIHEIERAMISTERALPYIAGIHLEGPYFSKQQAGAQNLAYITAPVSEDYTQILQHSRVRRWSYAPELDPDNVFLHALNMAGIKASIAHSDAIYDDVLRAHNGGCDLVTHLYSGMSTITRQMGYRRLGVVESAFLLDDMYVEVIADGCHLPPELLKLIYKIKGRERICLVTDAMRAAGTDEQQSFIGTREEGLPCIIEDGVAKLPDRSAFAGSVATADRLVRTMVKQVGVGVVDAVRMITENPAAVMGIKDRGRLSAASVADIVIFDDDINIKTVIVGGRLLFEAV